MSLSQEQRKRLEGALAEWPEKTYLSWGRCGIGFLCQRVEINMPTGDSKCPVLFQQLKRHYGLSTRALQKVFDTSLMFWLTALKKSRKQKATLEEFLKEN